jgi:hypothetical protein
MNTTSGQAKKAYAFIDASDVCGDYKKFARGIVHALTGVMDEVSFQIGDCVKVKKPRDPDDRFLTGKVGTIVADPSDSMPGVQFTRSYDKRMHDCYGQGRDGYCWWIEKQSLVKVKPSVRGKK